MSAEVEEDVVLTEAVNQVLRVLEMFNKFLN